jgi:sterol desaturase/sphingolipid hydroxylase (fatty acid hydroxylase superfamily)
MFESDFVDGFSRIPWYVVPILYLPVSLGLLIWGVAGVGLPALAALGAFAAGWFAWTFSEYWFHRTVFHWVPGTAWGPRMHFILHGVHHEWHWDAFRLVMPPAVSLILLAIHWALFQALLGPAWMFPVLGGYVFGYMVYDCTHYAIHHVKPRTRVGRRLRAHHMNHHHNDPERRFGVSNTLWDHVFRTC